MTKGQPNESSIDITLIVNIHSGTSYLARTMLSIEEAASYADGLGIHCELLFVMDRSPAETLAWAKAYRSDAFATRNMIEVDNGSLGLSRNDGLNAACGEIILFCDEDDLISYNLIAELYSTAKTSGSHTVVVPEYFLVFGARFLAYRYFGSGVYSPLQFISDHPFTSRICIHRCVVENTCFSDVRLETGFAYEDYHFNSKLVALGFRFIVAPNTVIFYREKANSLLQSMRSLTTRQIPPAPLFEPRNYLSVCAADYDKRDHLRLQYNDKNTTGAEFFTNPTCLELTHAANRIDPGIDISRVAGNSATTLKIPLVLGVAYYEACKKIKSSTFTDAVLFPFITKGGGEKYILNVLDAIQLIDPDARFLVLAGQRFKVHSWVDRLPKNAIFLDLPSLHPDLTDDQIDILTLRLVTSVATSARVHVKASPYTHRFVEKFGSLLRKNRLIYYRFCDGVAQIDGQEFIQGFGFDFLSENVSRIDYVLTDHRRIFEHDISRLDVSKAKWKLLSTPVEPLNTAEHIMQRSPTFRRRLIWTSRLDRQKRPELLCAIAECLCRSDPSIDIDVYGSPALDDFDVARFKHHPNLNYYGEYDGLDTVPHAEYDAQVYTTAFDGLPICVLDAFSAGLPVIAPDIGGVGEVVIPDETGILVQGGTDAELVESYVAAIVSLYSDAGRFLRLRCNALEFVKGKHSFADFRTQVADIFSNSIK
jgi:glycosyltransferase involved in cell wall biosynthesis